MMGALILFDPSIEPDESSGVKYYLKSLEFNPDNVGALFNIIETFGTSINNHRNTNAFVFAINRLQSINYKLSSSELELLNKKLEDLNANI